MEENKDITFIGDFEVAKIKITGILNLQEDSKKVIEEKKKGSSYSSSSYQGSGYNWNQYNAECDLRSVYFYEMSDLNRAPKFFGKVSAFVTWAKEHNILISDTKAAELRRMPTSYNICKEGCNTITTRVSRYLLEQALASTSAITQVSQASNGYNHSSCAHPGCYDPGYDDYYSQDFY